MPKWKEQPETNFLYFLKSEFTGKGGWEELDTTLLNCLSLLRREINHPFIIHAGYATEGHAKNSYHYRGQAIDFHIDELPFREAVVTLVVALWRQGGPLNGLGIYPDWTHPGFHLDIRKLLWQSWVQKTGQYIYAPSPEFYQVVAAI